MAPSIGVGMALAFLGLFSTCAARSHASPPDSSGAADHIVVPRIWDEEELATWATPLAGIGAPPGHFSEEEYYSVRIDNLRTYPVYHPRFEPPGYRDWMKAQGPQPLIDPQALKTKADWVEAGRLVFEQLDTEISRTDDPIVIDHFSDAAKIDQYRDETHDAMTPDGIILDYRWVVDHDGLLKISLSSCSGCHTRLMPDGTLLAGAPSNYDLGDSPATAVLLAPLRPPSFSAGEKFYQLYGVPWRGDDLHARYRTYTDEQIAEFFSQDPGSPPGTVFNRFNGSPLFTTRMADLIGVKDRRYLDATGTHANRGPEDIARYGILVEFADNGVFGSHQMMPEMNQRLRVRPPDEAMYALGLYVYSLDPPKSPHRFDARAQRGEKIFQEEGCAACHTPPAYTDNMLVPVPGFEPPMADSATRKLNISPRRVDTDPGLALMTRKGTGYYKTPSLRGLWYRGLYEHSGSVSSLEDWFDPARLQGSHIPSGWRGPGVKARAVPGHTFGLDLPPEDQKALIAFLKTL